ncbi:MAG: hypothetical protein IPN69_15425 [Acidobacteria bacterium]|nr:hypothetical protein [Acidobacteriota bacterium]MBK8812103.1 hypothetical protein [Acidobacteriota bacterium]
MLLAILAAWFGYKKANDSGRNGILWAFICAGAFIGTQLVCGLVIGLFFGIGIAAFGWNEDIYETYSIVVNLAAIAFSILVVYLIFSYLDRIPEDEPPLEVPSPPTF